MTRWLAFRQLILARVREFFREPEAIFWVYGFPILLALGLGVAFSGSQAPAPEVDVVQDDYGRAEQALKALLPAGVKAEVHPEQVCKDRLIKGRTALYLTPAADRILYVYDPARAESQLARRWVDAALARAESALPPAEDEHIEEPGSRYIDFLLPGLIGMNIMGGGLFGVGFVLVDMRVRKLFKRLIATPMHRGDFLMSLLTARLLFLMPEVTALLVMSRLWGVPVHGSFVTLLLVILAGAFAFSGLGLFLGSRADKTETVSGYMNLTMLPMYLLSGVFFTSKRFPDAMQPFIQALPLTQLNDALREVMLEGAGLMQIGWRLAILAAWAVVCFTLALRWFRWR
jgi:ABC-2 type transport system permease protein